MIQSWILGTPIWTVSVVATSEEDDITNLSRSSGWCPGLFAMFSSLMSYWLHGDFLSQHKTKRWCSKCSKPPSGFQGSPRFTTQRLIIWPRVLGLSAASHQEDHCSTLAAVPRSPCRRRGRRDDTSRDSSQCEVLPQWAKSLRWFRSNITSGFGNYKYNCGGEPTYK